MMKINGRTGQDLLDQGLAASAEDLFDSSYTTDELRYELELTISPVRDADRYAELADAEGPWFFRVAVVNALAALNVSVSTINKRRW